MDTARDIAVKALVIIRRKGTWADEVLHSQLEKSNLSPEDAAFCSRLVYGVLQNQGLLDFYLGTFCKHSLKRLQPPLLDILRTGAYQILFMDRVPDRAAVYESVNLAKHFKREWGKGIINVVLRTVARKKKSLPPVPEKNREEYLSIRYSHPPELVHRILELLDEEEAERFLEANNTIPPIEVQVNPLRSVVEDLQREMGKNRILAVPHAFVPGCLELVGAGDLKALPMFQEGKFYVQDPAGRLAILAADIRPGQRVMDVCAAPGGKSFGAALAVGDRGRVVSCDVNAVRLQRVQEGAVRLGLDAIIQTAEADGRRFHPSWAGRFDVVLVDVPCSGLGVIRKKPDIRYQSDMTYSSLLRVQGAILANAASYVRPGGTLLYSTCTILPEENQDVTKKFLAEHPDFSLSPFSLPSIGQTEGDVTLWPQRHGTDGFYICRMVRR